MKITVVYNTDHSGDAVVEDSVKTARDVSQALTKLGHQTKLFELKDTNLPKDLPDVFFNLAWGIGADENSEDKVANLLEKTGVAYTGADAKAIKLSDDKFKTKKLLEKNNIPTPKYKIIKNLNFPVIIKPNGENCSIGISQSSIYIEPILIEEYIEGRELNVTVLENEVLPISEITFGPVFKNKYKIVDYVAKWEKDTLEYKQTVGVCPAKLTVQEQEIVEETAQKTFLVTGCRDYARVDIRLRDKIPYILEVNINPAIGTDDGAVRSAQAGGYSYGKFLEKVVKLAYDRHQAQIA